MAMDFFTNILTFYSFIKIPKQKKLTHLKKVQETGPPCWVFGSKPVYPVVTMCHF